MMMHIQELLAMTDLTERNKCLQRSFAPDTTDLEVDGKEVATVVVLLNLTVKRDRIANVCDEQHARQLLLDERHLADCLHAVRWLHSHNLKYPDCRVSEQRLIIDSPAPISGVITSAGLPMRLGWANNSAKINAAKLFGSSFWHQGSTTNLALQLVTGKPVWQAALEQLGLPSEHFAAWVRLLAQHIEVARVPVVVSQYSKQVRLPYQGGYCAITPVVSHALLAHLQQALRLKALRYTVVSHAHPASVGSLAGALGGNIAVLDYPPPVSKQKERDFAQSRARRLAEGASLFDRSILNDRVFINALHHLVFPRGEAPRRQQRQLRRSALRYLRRQLALWLGPLIEWRDEVEHSGSNLGGELLADGLEYGLITQRQAQLPELLQPVMERFHLELQQHPDGKYYAFHPALMVPIKSQLLWLLRQFANAEVPEAVTDPENCHYLHLAGLTVYDASALANPYLCGIPSLSAVAGFCHDYERRLGALLKHPVHFRGVAWYLSRYSRVTGKQLPTPREPERASVVSPIRRPGVLDDKKCDLGMDLVIEVQFSSTRSSLANFVELLRAALPARFAGGCLHPPSLYEAKEWCTLYQDPAELFNLLSRLPRYGCWVYPANTKVGSVEELGEALSMEPRLRPVATGFVFLEEPVERTGSLEHKHVYAESAISTALCINPIEMRLAGKNRFYRNGFWRLSGGNEAILMTGSARMG